MRSLRPGNPKRVLSSGVAASLRRQNALAVADPRDEARQAQTAKRHHPEGGGEKDSVEPSCEAKGQCAPGDRDAGARKRAGPPHLACALSGAGECAAHTEEAEDWPDRAQSRARRQNCGSSLKAVGHSAASTPTVSAVSMATRVAIQAKRSARPPLPAPTLVPMRIPAGPPMP